MLFDKGEAPSIPKRPANPCTPAPIGSGPDGETCRTCQHYTRVRYRSSVYLKCGLMTHEWTHGAGTDIKAGWPACREYTIGTKVGK